MEGKTVIHIDIYQVDSIPEPKVPYQLVMQKFFLLSDTLIYQWLPTHAFSLLQYISGL
jgi:hypothetical protein